ncbi:hypothetical protein GHA01_23370 [Novacetimonas hansenii]|uniref:Transposase n=1 Tax=Novacetimonas hansenii TaxID=436 RepID=A0ABQ0SGU0_NOVHA|nr:hypothetical protein GHA01_23370 [Novacetimonas hansenii]
MRTYRSDKGKTRKFGVTTRTAPVHQLLDLWFEQGINHAAAAPQCRKCRAIPRLFFYRIGLEVMPPSHD